MWNPFLGFRQLLTSEYNERFDEAISEATSLGFKVEYLDSSYLAAGLRYEQSDYIDVVLTVHITKETKKIGNFTYIMYEDTGTPKSKNKEATEKNLSVQLMSILREMEANLKSFGRPYK